MFAAVINHRVVSHMPRDMMRGLVALYHIHRPYPVSGIFRTTPVDYFGNEKAMRSNLTCMNNFHQDIFGNAELEYLRPVKVWDVISSSHFCYNGYQNPMR